MGLAFEAAERETDARLQERHLTFVVIGGGHNGLVCAAYLAAAADPPVLAYRHAQPTPAAMPIRFNARFLIAPAEAARGEIKGSGELDELRFFPLDEAAGHKVATITAKIMAEFRAWLAMSPAERDQRELVCFRGMDNRLPEL